MSYLIIGDPSGLHCLRLIEKGISKDDIVVWEDSDKGKYIVSRLRGCHVVSDLEELNGMKFDVVVGNPPYGSGGNLAIRFLNKCGDLSDDIRLVLPVSIRKPSSQNKVRLDLVCVEDEDLSEETFGKNITAVRQRWVKTDSLRDKIQTFTTHPDFEFVKADEADLMVGRSGAGPCGRVKTEDFQHYADDHFFIRTNSIEITQRIVSLEPEFLSLSRDTSNGRPHLSKNELITLYISKFGRGKIQTFTTHPDFEFVKKDNNPNIMIFRCGASTGKATVDFDDNKPDHYYIKADSDIIERLKNITDELIVLSKKVNGMPGISKHDLITTYISHYG